MESDVDETQGVDDEFDDAAEQKADADRFENRYGGER